MNEGPRVMIPDRLFGRHGILAALAIVSVVFTFLGCKNVEIPSSWAAEAIVVDGDIADWSDIQKAFFKEENVSVGISNDSGNLYLLFRTNDMDLLRAVQMTGLTLWLDVKGKKEKKLAFRYFGGPSVEEMAKAGLIGSEQIGRMAGGHGPKSQGEGRKTESRFEIEDKKGGYKEGIPSDGIRGPAVRYGLSQSFCSIEIKIPLQQEAADFYGINAQPGSKIAIGAVWGGGCEDRPGGPMRDRDGGPLDGGGRDRPGMGVPPGGGPGERKPPSGRTAPEHHEVWIVSELANSNSIQPEVGP